MLYLDQVQPKLDVPRCENLGCDLRKKGESLGVRIELPSGRFEVGWTAPDGPHVRKIFLCCECEKQCKSSSEIQIGVIQS